MFSPIHHLQRGCIMVIFFFMAGCSLEQTLKKPDGEEEFFQETSRLEETARQHPQASVRAQSHLQLAYLYVDHRNPRLSYARALQEMESYLSLSPAVAKNGEFHSWLAILQEVAYLRQDRKEMGRKNRGLQTNIEKLQSSLEKAQESNRSLRDEVARLKEMNHKMKETIESLTSLDSQLEEKRNLIK
jgi:hypothetical protein